MKLCQTELKLFNAIENRKPRVIERQFETTGTLIEAALKMELNLLNQLTGANFSTATFSKSGSGLSSDVKIC